VRRAAPEHGRRPTSRTCVIRSRRSTRGGQLEVLGCESLVTPATAAYRMYVQNSPGKLVLLRWGGKVIRRSRPAGLIRQGAPAAL
jgi:hypothetical protein